MGWGLSLNFYFLPVHDIHTGGKVELAAPTEVLTLEVEDTVVVHMRLWQTCDGCRGIIIEGLTIQIDLSTDGIRANVIDSRWQNYDGLRKHANVKG